MRVLFTVLNWGLGHASRSAPVIELLERSGCEVILASDGLAHEWLSKRFPKLPIHTIQGLQPVYPEGNQMVWSMAKQLPSFMLALSKEHRSCLQLAQQLQVSGIVSDNRYGCYHSQIPSVMIGHQLQLRFPEQMRWLSPLVQAYNHQSLRKFNEVWVPDYADHQLSGELSNWNDSRVRFIGPLSHLKPLKAVSGELKKYLFLLSGPEPQRGILERKIWRWPKLVPKDCTVVRGTTEPKKQSVPMGMEVYDLLQSEELASLIQRHQMVIARPGYSTLMDLQQFSVKALFIPTPGQTEQEYLGMRIQQQGLAHCTTQDEVQFDLDLEKANQSSGFKAIAPSTVLLQQTVANWLSKL